MKIFSKLLILSLLLFFTACTNAPTEKKKYTKEKEAKIIAMRDEGYQELKTEFNTLRADFLNRYKEIPFSTFNDTFNGFEIKMLENTIVSATLDKVENDQVVLNLTFDAPTMLDPMQHKQSFILTFTFRPDTTVDGEFKRISGSKGNASSLSVGEILEASLDIPILKTK